MDGTEGFPLRIHTLGDRNCQDKDNIDVKRAKRCMYREIQDSPLRPRFAPDYISFVDGLTGPLQSSTSCPDPSHRVGSTGCPRKLKYHSKRVKQALDSARFCLRRSSSDPISLTTMSVTDMLLIHLYYDKNIFG